MMESATAASSSVSQEDPTWCHRCRQTLSSMEAYREHCRQDPGHIEAIRRQQQANESTRRRRRPTFKAKAKAKRDDTEMDASSTSSSSSSLSDDEDEASRTTGYQDDDTGRSDQNGQSAHGLWTKNPALTPEEHVKFVAEQLWKGSALAEFSVIPEAEAAPPPDEGKGDSGITHHQTNKIEDWFRDNVLTGKEDLGVIMLRTWKSLLPQNWFQFAQLARVNTVSPPVVLFPRQMFFHRRVCDAFTVPRDLWAVILFSSGHFALSIFENKKPKTKASTSRVKVDPEKWNSADSLSCLDKLTSVIDVVGQPVGRKAELKDVVSRLVQNVDSVWEPVFHKTLHKYTTRKKQGGSQSAKDASGKKVTSVGAQIRRQNEILLATQIHELLASLRPLLECCSRLFLGASRSNMNILFGSQAPGQAPTSTVDKIYSKNYMAFSKEAKKFVGDNFSEEQKGIIFRYMSNEERCVLRSDDQRIRKISFITGRPTYQETQNVYRKLRYGMIRLFDPTEHCEEWVRRATTESSEEISPLAASNSVPDSAPSEWQEFFTHLTQLDFDEVVSQTANIGGQSLRDFYFVELTCKALAQGIFAHANTSNDTNWQTSAYAITDYLLDVIGTDEECIVGLKEFIHCFKQHAKRIFNAIKHKEEKKYLWSFIEQLATEMKARNQDCDSTLPEKNATSKPSKKEKETVQRSAPNSKKIEEEEALNSAMEEAGRKKAIALEEHKLRVHIDDLQQKIDTIQRRCITRFQHDLEKQSMGQIADPDVRRIYASQWEDISKDIWSICINRTWESFGSNGHNNRQGHESLQQSADSLAERYERAQTVEELMQVGNMVELLTCLGWNTAASFYAAAAMPEDWIQMLDSVKKHELPLESPGSGGAMQSETADSSSKSNKKKSSGKRSKKKKK